VEGSCDPGFAPVRDAFRGNFGDRGEFGGAVCVMVDGRVVVDLRGGWADPDRRRRWRPDTLVNVFSVGKGLIAACAARLAGQGRLDLDATVASCWPEFGAAGKDAITVRQLLSHQAGLPAVRRRLPPGSMLDWPVMTAALAAQEPWWEPGTGHGYHVNTFGFLVGEVIRRSTGSTVGTVLREEIAGPLGADVHIGLPASQHSRVATFAWPGPPPAEEEPPGLEPARLMEYNAYFNPGGLAGAGVINTRTWRAAEVSPSAT
jgi:CubicO group peptidase (beta-lactamase class C family)